MGYPHRGDPSKELSEARDGEPPAPPVPGIHTHAGLSHSHLPVLCCSLPLLSTRLVSCLRAGPAEPHSAVNLPGPLGFGSSTPQGHSLLITCGRLDPTLAPAAPARVGTAALSTFGVSSLVQNSSFLREVQVIAGEVYISLVLPD